ncbi:NAD+ synthase [Oxyplasma meridianum]|uniref:NH(3)-dependent NAD(+) synthetase n=1 Tax=Oxyplasma meridianum TaxID=3073602 RepID=A0AAX4NFH9_9ARCH
MDFSLELEKIGHFITEKLAGKDAVLGISGGVDSALVLSILARVLPKERIRAFFMPDSNTPETDLDDVKKLSESTKIEIKIINIESVVEAFRSLLSIEDRYAMGNVKSRTRMIILYYFANINNGLVIGTTNRTEHLIGYYTKFGDGACDIEPIMHLYKQEVWDFATFMKVPDNIIRKKPSAGLWEGQTDEDEIGMTYSDLDKVLEDVFDLNLKSLTDKHKKVEELHERSEHKRKLPEFIKAGENKDR